MKDKKTESEKKIILFPGLINRLIENGMKEHQSKNYQSSLDLFLQALELEPDHPQARLGIVLSYMELNLLEEAAQESEEMLKKGIGNYYEVLQLHISLLVQTEKYDQVVTILEAVLAENKVPAQYAESFYQLLHYSRNKQEDTYLIEDETQSIGAEEALKLLESKDTTLQLQGLQEFRKLSKLHKKKELMFFLEDEKNDILLKTFVLQILKEKEVDEPVKIVKFGRSLHVTPLTLEDPEEIKFASDVLTFLENELEHDNPSILQIAKEIWWQYILAIYPFVPMPEEAKLWAATVYLVSMDSQGMEFDELDIAKLYDIDLKLLLHKTNEVSTVLEMYFNH